MKNTYYGTMFHSELKEEEITIYIYEKCKYKNNTKPISYRASNNIIDHTIYLGSAKHKIRFKNVICWSIINGNDAKEIEARINDIDDIDDYHEYLILHFTNGETQIFKNSYVDMFI